jgi:hypothetical protein
MAEQRVQSGVMSKKEVISSKSLPVSRKQPTRTIRPVQDQEQESWSDIREIALRCRYQRQNLQAGELSGSPIQLLRIPSSIVQPSNIFNRPAKLLPAPFI